MADEHELTWRLDPGTDLLERTGLAALYMALRAAAEMSADLSPLTWREEDLKPDSVTVRWSGPAKPAFVKLMEWAWQVRDGVLYMPAVHDLRERSQWWLRVPTHNGIMGTFFQSSRIQPRAGLETRIVQLDEQREIETRFFVLCAPVKPHRDVHNLFEGSGARKADFRHNGAELSTWVARGFSARYPSDGYGKNWQEKSWRGPAQRAFLLMLVPTVCLYFRLHGKGNNWLVVTPDVHDLTEFDGSRRRMFLNQDFIDVGSLSDAGLRFLSDYSTHSVRRSLRSSCRVSAFGIVGYFHKANATRKAVLDLSTELSPVRRYRLLHRELPNTYETWKVEHPSDSLVVKLKRRGKKPGESSEPKDDTPKAAGRFKLPAARGRIAENLIAGRLWCADLAIPMGWDHEWLERRRKRNKELNDRDGKNRPTSHETILFAALHDQRRKLMNLIAENDMGHDERDRAFLEAFWDTLSRLYFLEGEGAKRGGSRSSDERMTDLNEKTRRELMQAKTRLLLRKTLAEFFAKPAKLARSQTLCENVACVWRIIDTNWQRGRDLALLALMTYQSREKREQPAQNNSTAQGA